MIKWLKKYVFRTRKIPFCEVCGMAFDPKLLWFGHQPSAQMITNIGYKGHPFFTYRCPVHKSPYDTVLHAPGFPIGMSFHNYIGRRRNTRPTETKFYDV